MAGDHEHAALFLHAGPRIDDLAVPVFEHLRLAEVPLRVAPEEIDAVAMVGDEQVQVTVFVHVYQSSPHTAGKALFIDQPLGGVRPASQAVAEEDPWTVHFPGQGGHIGESVAVHVSHGWVATPLATSREALVCLDESRADRMVVARLDFSGISAATAI